MYVEGDREKEGGERNWSVNFLEGLEEITNQKEGARIKWRVEVKSKRGRMGGGEDEEEKKKQSGKEKKEPKRSIAREARRLVGDDK